MIPPLLPWDPLGDLLSIGPPRERFEDPEHPFVGQMLIHGLVIDVESVTGQWRTGVDPDGRPWAVQMPAMYGEVQGTTGSDFEPIDVFIGPDPFALHVYVFQTANMGHRKGSYEETKNLIGFPSREAAEACFDAAYDLPGFKLGCTEWPFAAWLEAMKRPRVQLGPMNVPLTKSGGARMILTGAPNPAA